MKPSPYRLSPIIPIFLIPLCTFMGMSVYQWLKHVFWPNIGILDSHIHTTLFLTAVSMVGGFLLCRYLEARSLLASIVESSEDAIVGITLDGVVFSWNTGAEKIYGYGSKEVVGQSLSILLPSDRSEDVSNILKKIKEGERVDHYETTRIRKDGTIVHVSLTVSPILNAAGRIIGASSIIRDITKRKETENALRESRARLARTQAFSLVMVAHLGLDGRWIEVPASLCELLGYSESELLGLTSEDITSREDRALERMHYKDLIEGRTKSVDLEKRCTTRDGRLLWLYLNYSIVSDSEGNPLHFLAYIRDITKRRMAEEDLKQANIYLENVIENSPDPIGIVDEHGMFIKWNSMAAELYGYNLNDLRGKPCFDLYADRDELEKMLNHLRRHRSVRKWEISMKMKDGSIAPFELSIGLLRDSENRVLGSVSVARDLSEIKKLVQERTMELARTNARLTREIEERKCAEQALQESSHKLKLFAYSVAHDLKSPAVGIHGLTRRLHQQYDQYFDEKGRLYCTQILKASEHIASLVEQVNTYIATKETPLNVELIELGEILRVLGDEFSARLSIRKIALCEPKAGIDFKADRLCILRVFRNLIDNALKYGGEQLSKITIEYDHSENFHIFSVSNDGEGLKSLDTEKIFGAFQRHKSSKEIEGTGLGLNIVKEIAERHGGKVWIGPASDRDITFNISISKHLQPQDQIRSSPARI